MNTAGLASLNRRLRTLWTHARRFGALSALHLLIFQLLENWKVLRVAFCNVLSTEGVDEGAGPGLPGLEVRQLTPHEIQGLMRRREPWFPPKAVKVSLERGDLCFAGFLDGEVVCSVWGSAEPLLQFELMLAPPEHGFIGYRLFTSPEHRGKRIQAAVRGEMLRHYRALGFHWYVETIIWTNASAIAGARRMGFKRVGLIIQIGPDAWRMSRLVHRSGPGLTVVQGVADPAMPERRLYRR